MQGRNSLKLGQRMANFSKHLEKRPALGFTVAFLWLSVISWFAFLWNLGNTGLIDETEPLFAEAARQMVVTNDWITPYFNGDTRFDKPPLIYWLMGLAYRLIGVNEWGARLPSALSAITLTSLGFYVLYYWERQPRKVRSENSPLLTEDLEAIPRVSRPQISLAPWIGAALIALNPETIAWGRIGVSDMLLTGCMCSALFAFFRGYAEEHPRIKFKWYLAFYCLVAFAILAKGPVGIVLPALIIGSFILYLGNWREMWQEMRPLQGLCLIVMIALPWYILVTLANGQAYIDSFFGYHNFQRFTQVVNRHSAPWYFYFLVVAIGFMPWSIYLPAAIARLSVLQRTYWRRQPRWNQLGLFAGFWFICIFGFFTIAVTKLPSYVLPLMPAAGILVTLLWTEILEGGETQEVAESPLTAKPQEGKFPPLLYGSFVVNTLFVLALGGAIFYSYNWVKRDPAMPDFSQAIQESGLLIIGGGIWTLTGIISLILLWQKREQWLLGLNVIAFMAFLIFAVTPTYQLLDQHRQLPLRELATRVTQEKRPGEELVMIGFPKPSLVFYTQGEVTYYRLSRAAIEYIQEIQQKSPPTVLMIGYPSKFTEINLNASEYQLLEAKGAYQLVRVDKQIVAQKRAKS